MAQNSNLEVNQEALDKMLLGLHSTLVILKTWGWQGADCSEQYLETLRNWHPMPQSALQGESLEEIRSDLGDCRRCTLAVSRTHLVFGEGDPQARLVFVGEGPGSDEDRSGRPFVGAAGQLLTKIIQAMSLDRRQVYICNVIKCRPPGNRDPKPEEIKICRPFLERQLAAIKPDVICALGAHAARTLLNTNESIFTLRGRFHKLGDIKVMPTFHPAFLLRNPNQKRAVWDDVRKIMVALGIPL